jgi:transglutaminase-like putative cysteine protease
MRLNIRHITHYSYDTPPLYLVQRLHLEPVAFDTQQTLGWKISTPGIETALRYMDGFGNWVHLVTAKPQSSELEVLAEGELITQDTSGVVRGLPVHVAHAVFLRETMATQCSAQMAKFVRALPRGSSKLEFAHELMRRVHEAIEYEAGTTHTHTTAAEAFADGKGVCQDHAHVMIACARQLGMPARYVTGYLVTGKGASTSAAHAWTEIAVPDLGWVGFDAANCQSPTDQYVRVASGLDASAVAPVRGTRRGGDGGEHMRVEVSVEISQQ